MEAIRRGEGVLKQDLTIRLGDELVKGIRKLRRELMLRTGREFSKAAVVRLLIFLGLQEAQKKALEALVAIAEQEDLL